MQSERTALLGSVFGSLFFGLLGIGFSFFTGSDAILLDGFFSLINCVIGLVTLRVAGMVVRPVDQRYQFGYASFEPLTNVVKGLIILLLCSFALFTAVETLFRGGRQMEMGWGVAYALVATAGCFGIAAIQRRAFKKTASPLLEVEAKSWAIDGMMSVVVALAFGGSFLLQGSQYERFLPYVDPSLVVLLVLFALPIPFRIVRDNLGELLLAAPPVDAQSEVHEKVQEVIRDLPVERTVIRMLKVGRQRAAIVYVLVSPNTAIEGIERLDEVRQAITDELKKIRPTWVADVLFVADERWIS